MDTLLDHLREIAGATGSAALSGVRDFRLVVMKRTIANKGILFDKGDYGLVPRDITSGDTPIFCFRKSAMTFVGRESFEILPDDTPFPDGKYSVYLAVRGVGASTSAPRPILDHMPPDEWVHVPEIPEASATCLRYFDTHQVTEDIWWGGAVKDAATCVPIASVRFDGTIWGHPEGTADASLIFDPYGSRLSP